MKGIAALWPLTLVMLGLIAGCASGPGEGSQEEAVKAKKEKRVKKVFVSFLKIYI